MFLTGLLTAFFKSSYLGMVPPTPIIRCSRPFLTGTTTDQYGWGTSSAELPSSQVTLDPVKLEVNLTTQPQVLSSFRPLSQHPTCFLHSQHSPYIKYHHTEDRAILLNSIYGTACHAFTKTLPSILISSFKKKKALFSCWSYPHCPSGFISHFQVFNYGSSLLGLFSVWEYTRDTCVLEPLNMHFHPRYLESWLLCFYKNHVSLQPVLSKSVNTHVHTHTHL